MQRSECSLLKYHLPFGGIKGIGEVTRCHLRAQVTHSSLQHEVESISGLLQVEANDSRRARRVTRVTP